MPKQSKERSLKSLSLWRSSERSFILAADNTFDFEDGGKPSNQVCMQVWLGASPMLNRDHL